MISEKESWYSWWCSGWRFALLSYQLWGGSDGSYHGKKLALHFICFARLLNKSIVLPHIFTGPAVNFCLFFFLSFFLSFFLLPFPSLNSLSFFSLHSFFSLSFFFLFLYFLFFLSFFLSFSLTLFSLFLYLLILSSFFFSFFFFLSFFLSLSLSPPHSLSQCWLSNENSR